MKKGMKKKPREKTDLSILPIGMQKTRVRPKRASDQPVESKSFSPRETGQPDPTPAPDLKNPVGVQGGRGPMNQEGEGNRQNAELEELEQIEPTIDLEK
jgi:hypothetical protein